MPERLFRHNEIHIHAEMRPIRTAAMNSFSFADFLKTPQGETVPPCKPCRPKADGCPFPPNRLIW